MTTSSARALLFFTLGLSIAACNGCGGAEKAKPAETAANPPAKTVDLPAEIKAIVDATDRSADDRALDAGRKPGELLTFLGVKPGMKVADIAAGRGYTTELLARAVGPSGVVYAQNNAWLAEKGGKGLDERLAKPVNKNVVKLARDFDDPLPPEAKDLDVVIDVLFYHDLYWMSDGKLDRAKMNAAILRALKPGGLYVVVDHSARAGSGSTEVKTLHRIEEKLVRDEIVAAGFKLAKEGDFLRNPSDTHDWNDAPNAAGDRRGKSDRFVLAFTKP